MTFDMTFDIIQYCNLYTLYLVFYLFKLSKSFHNFCLLVNSRASVAAYTDRTVCIYEVPLG